MRFFAWCAGALLAPLGVGCASPLASELAQPPEYAPEGQTKCAVRKSQEKPLVVEWPSADRAELEAGMKRGPVVVRYDGCSMTLLSHCRVPGAYRYDAVTPKRDELVIRDVDELYSSIPIGAARLEGKLATAGQLSVEMTLVGRYRLDDPQRTPEQLEGACEGATHVIAGLSVGAFEFFAGAEATVAGGATVLDVGGGTKGSASREKLAADGDGAACAAAGEQGPPPGCGAVLRVEVVGIAWPNTPQCPAGSSWNGANCVAMAVACPAGSTFDGRRCVSAKKIEVADCPRSTTWNGERCVASQVACPGGSAWDGLTCRPLAGGKQPNCPANTLWDGTMCADATLKFADTCTTMESCAAQCEQANNLNSCFQAADRQYSNASVTNVKLSYFDFGVRACRGGILRACEWAGDILVAQSDAKDKALAAELSGIGCRGGDLESCTLLGRCYLYGAGVEKNIQQGVVLLRRACSSGESNACGYIDSMGYER